MLQTYLAFLVEYSPGIQAQKSHPKQKAIAPSLHFAIPKSMRPRRLSEKHHFVFGYGRGRTSRVANKILCHSNGPLLPRSSDPTFAAHKKSDGQKNISLSSPSQKKKTTHMKHLDTTAEKKSSSSSFPPLVSQLFACFYVAPFVCLSFWRRFIFGGKAK